MHKLLTRQLAKAVKRSGKLDLQTLLAFVSEAYERFDNDRHRTDRSISLMIKELEQLNCRLDQLVRERTAALREREAELREQNVRFDAALKNMPFGLCMFDGDHRLIVCNERYSEMYGLAPGQMMPGTTTLRSILDARIAVGRSPEDTDAYVAQCLTDVRRRDSHYIEITIRDGSTFAVNHRPLPDGGCVAIHQDITAQKRAEMQITYMARHDGLTSLANRAVLLGNMEEAVARLKRHGSRFTVFVLDLDLFKTVNDSLGHPVGDELLKRVAGRLTTCTRESDTVARLGGDEFAILASAGDDQREAAMATAAKLLDAVAAPYDLDGHQLNIGTSIGIALAPEHGTEVDQLMKNADLALYKAKSAGRDAYRFFETAMEVEAHARRAHQIELRSALANGEFALHYQPIIDIKTGEIASIEALIRWQHPQRGMIAPCDFIPLAEETGLINPIGDWVLRKACSDAADWPSPIRLAVNLSAVQFRKAGLIDNLSKALNESGLPPERLELEITESVLLQNNVEHVETLHRLRLMGISIVLDDFGTGYSSLSYLRTFPFDRIKIDRSFVHELAKNADCAAIVSAVAGLGANLRMGTVAEGVETADQLLLVHAAGCTHAQGYLFGRPCPAAELTFDRVVERERRSKVA